QNDNVQSSQPASNILQPMVSQPVFLSYNEMQKSFQAIIDKQDTKHKAKMEKLKAEFESKMSQQPKKSHHPLNLSREKALQWLDKAFPPSIANRIESKVDEIGQLTSQFGRMILDNQSKKPVAKSNSTHQYFSPLIPSQSQYASLNSDDIENSEGGYNEEDNI
ncbi:213_t:CDS:2, partial [Dentiscutata erythropus]